MLIIQATHFISFIHLQIQQTLIECLLSYRHYVDTHDTAMNKRDAVAIPKGTYSPVEGTALNKVHTTTYYICLYIHIYNLSVYLYACVYKYPETQKVIQIKISAVKKKHGTFKIDYFHFFFFSVHIPV